MSPLFACSSFEILNDPSAKLELTHSETHFEHLRVQVAAAWLGRRLGAP